MDSRATQNDPRPRRHHAVDDAVFEGEVVLFDERTRMLHQLNAVAGGAWLLSDGDTTVAQMTADLSDVLHVPPAELGSLVEEAVSRFAAAGLLEGTEPAAATADPSRHEGADGERHLCGETDP